MLDSTNFPGFRDAINSGEIRWDLDALPFKQQADKIDIGMVDAPFSPIELKSIVYVFMSCVQFARIP